MQNLLNYHIKEDHLPSGYWLARKEAILLILGLGGLNYVPIAYQNGNTVTMSIINSVTTAFLGEVLLYTSGDIYYKIKLQPQSIPDDLKDVIEAPLSSTQFMRDVALQSFSAAASAIPLATTLFDADLAIFEKYPELFWGALAYIEIVNTAMHLVPIELTMRDPYYGFFPLLLQRGWRFITGYQPTAEEQDRADQLDKRAIALGEINPLLSVGLTNFLRKLLDMPENERSRKLSAYQSSPETLLQDVLNSFVETPLLNPIARNTARVLGGSVVSLACLGYAANPYLVFKNDFDFSTGAALGITTLPIYFFMVLMFFFGDGMGVRLLQDILSLKDIALGRSTFQEKLPLEARYYPKAFAFSVMLILFDAIFAGAPGREMMKMAFEAFFPAWLMVVMCGVVDVGLSMLSCYALLDFTKMLFNYYAQYQDNGCVHEVAIIKAKMEAFIRDVNRIKPEFAQKLNQDIKSLVSESNKEESLASIEETIEETDPNFPWPVFFGPRSVHGSSEVTERLLPSQ